MILSPNRHIFLNADLEGKQHNKTIDIHYSDSGDTKNMKFSFIFHISIPIPEVPTTSPTALQAPVLAFLVDGSKLWLTAECQFEISKVRFLSRHSWKLPSLTTYTACTISSIEQWKIKKKKLWYL